MVSNKGKAGEHNEENDQWKKFTVRFVNNKAEKGLLGVKYLKAERGGGGAFGAERPQTMMTATANVQFVLETKFSFACGLV